MRQSPKRNGRCKMSKEMDGILVEQLTIKNTCLKHQVERLQEQLNEANEAIDEAYWDCFREGFEPELATEYRKKYGLNANDDKYK